MFRPLRQLFSKKWLISLKTTKHHRLGKNYRLFEQTIMLRRFGELFSKKLPKVAHFVKKHEKSSIWPSIATLRENQHLSAFWSTFQQKVAKSGSFREKARKLINLAKFSNFASKLSCFGVLVKFSTKSWKKWLILWTSTKNHPFGQNLELFEETTMFRRLGQLFSKKLQKLAHLVIKHKKSSIWQKEASFREN